MTDKQALLALAERCEQATAGNSEIDALIWCAIHGKKYKSHHKAYGSTETQIEFTSPPKRTRQVTGCYGVPHAANWTSSLDAALTLVPAGHVFTVADWWCDDEVDGKPPHFADCADRALLNHGVDCEIHKAWAHSKPLALTAASLRAIAGAME